MSSIELVNEPICRLYLLDNCNRHLKLYNDILHAWIDHHLLCLTFFLIHSEIWNLPWSEMHILFLWAWLFVTLPRSFRHRFWGWILDESCLKHRYLQHIKIWDRLNINWKAQLAVEFRCDMLQCSIPDWLVHGLGFLEIHALGILKCFLREICSSYAGFSAIKILGWDSHWLCFYWAYIECPISVIGWFGWWMCMRS